MAEMDVAGVVLRREKSRWMPELGVGGFTQKLDGTPGFNGLQASASVPLSPGVYRNRVREGQINLSNSELEVVQAQREWETITTKLATDLERWKPEPHHSDRGEQTPEELWQLYESGALDLDGYWGAMSAKSERELLDIEHRFHYQKIIIEWNFYQSTAL
jgi:hypothetical protein